MSSNKVPKAFISYSHDSLDHKKWVLDLATRLRCNGVDAILDQWELGPGDDLPHFMEQNLAAADRVLMVCTENYVKKANAGAGGVGYEKMIVTSELSKRIDSNKVIPLIRQTGTHDVPIFLKSKRFLDFSIPDQFEFSFDELIRSIHNAPLYVKPAISNNPFAHVSETPVEKTGDGVLTLMKIIIEQFELLDDNDDDHIPCSTLRINANMSRTLFETCLDQAEAQGFIAQPRSDFDTLSRGKSVRLFRSVRLLPKGRSYALQHRLIEG